MSWMPSEIAQELQELKQTKFDKAAKKYGPLPLAYSLEKLVMHMVTEAFKEFIPAWRAGDAKAMKEELADIINCAEMCFAKIVQDGRRIVR